MIRKIVSVFFLFAILSCNMYARVPHNYRAKWHTTGLFGVNVPITKLMQGREVELLIGYSDKPSPFLQVLSTSHIFRKNWGFEASIRFAKSGKSIDRTENFISNIKSEYGENYFVSDNTISGDDGYFVFGDIMQMYFGVIYQYEINRFYAYPKFSIGFNLWNVNNADIALKEKNSNNAYTLTYFSESAGPLFIIMPAVSIGYKLFKRLYLNADISFSYSRSGIVYEKKFTDLYTRKSIVEKFDYRKNLFTFSASAGLIFVIYIK